MKTPAYETIYFVGGAMDGAELFVINNGKNVYMMPERKPLKWRGSKAEALSIYRRRRGTNLFDYGRIILN